MLTLQPRNPTTLPGVSKVPLFKKGCDPNSLVGLVFVETTLVTLDIHHF